MKTKDRGNAGLGKAISYFTSIGGIVSIPLTDTQEYDLLVDINGSVKKVQVRTTIFIDHSGNYAVKTSTNGGNRSNKNKNRPIESSKIDYLFVVAGNGFSYLIPSTEVNQKYRMNLGPDRNKFIVGEANIGA